MDRSLILWTLALCVGFTARLAFDSANDGEIYGYHHFLKDQATGLVKKPSDLMYLDKVLNVTEDYIASTNAIERLQDLELGMNLENPVYVDQSYSDEAQLRLSGWPVANQSKCAHQLGWILRELQQFNDTSNYMLLRGQRGLEFTQLVGSIGKPEAELFSTGLVSWLGSYSKCQSLVMSEPSGPLKMRFCWSRMRPKWWSKERAIYPATVVRVGTCLPESCDTLSERMFAKEIEQLVKFEWPEFYAKNFNFESLFCLPDERSPLRQMSRAGHWFLCAMGAWVALVLIATVMYELDGRQQRRRSPAEAKTSLEMAEFDRSARSQLLEALSIHCSIKRFKTHRFWFSYSEAKRGQISRPRVDLGCLDFFKINMAILIILGHSAYQVSIYSRALGNKIDNNTGYWGHFFISIGRCVDTFFMFFGVLTSYTIMRKFSTTQLSSPLVWMRVNLSILLRLSPVFVLVYLYARLVGPYTGASPWWDYGVEHYTPRGVCMRESWLKAIPYFGIIDQPSASSCNFPAWFIVSYSQISLLLPLVTYIIVKFPNCYSRILLILFFCFVSVFKISMRQLTQTSINYRSYPLYGGFMANLMEKYEFGGQMSSLGRVGCVSIGCYVGYLLRRYESGEISRWPRWLKWKTTLVVSLLLSVVIVCLPILGHYVFVRAMREGTMEEFVIVNAIIMLAWPVLLSILIICASTMYNHVAIIRFFGHPFWHAFNRLGLCIYLIHWEVLVYLLTSYEKGPSNGLVMDVFKLWALGTIATIVLSFFVHILLEQPLAESLMILGNGLMNKMLRRNARNRVEISTPPSKSMEA